MSTSKRAEVVDRYGELSRQIDAFEPTNKEAKRLEKEIAGWYEQEAAEQEFIAEGRLYLVKVSAKSEKRGIFDLSKVFGLLGKAKFLEVASVTLAAIDKLIDPARHPEIVEKARTGPRRLEPVAKVALKKAA